MIDWLSPDLLPPGVRAGFTSRHGGVSTGDYASLNLGFHVGDEPAAVRANRDLLQSELGIELVWMSQVHGAAVAPANEATRGELGYLSVGEADGVVVAGGEGAAVMVADCVPLLLVREDGLRGAAVHVGRAGFDAGIARYALHALCATESGENCGGGKIPGTANVRAFLGPAICGRCYEVGADLATDVDSRWSGSAVETRWGTAGIDVPGGLERQLRELGVVNIVRSQVCTYESDTHFSHRRATHQGTRAGRFVGFIAIT